MGKQFFKRPINAHSAQTYSSGVNSTGPVTGTLGFRETSQTAALTTGTTTITNYGLTQITSTGALSASLTAPVAGYHKIIVMATASTGDKTAAVTCASGSYFSDSTGATTDRKVTFNRGDQAIMLIGLSTLAWHILNKTSTAVVVGTT